MRIPFASRSRFIEPVAAELRARATPLLQAGTMRLDLGQRGGYKGVVRLTIGGDATYFDTDWEGKDPTRFPARIKAAATALRDAGMTGTFVITHDDGALTIVST